MKNLLIPLFSVVLVSSCATQSQQAKTEGTALGCAAGAIAGGLIGWGIGGNATGAAIGAGTGGLAGCAAGYSLADSVDKQRAELADKEGTLDEQIQFAKDSNTEIQQYNQSLKTKIEEYNREVSELKSKTGSQESTRKELEIEKQKINNDLQQAQNKLATAQKDLNTSKTFRSTQSKQSPELDALIKKKENAILELQTNIKATASMSQRI